MDKPGEYDVVHPIWQRGRDWGIHEERERIVALLDDPKHHDIFVAPKGLHTDTCRSCSLIALIKGEY